MSEAQPWLGRCHLTKPEGETEVHYEALAAVFCDTREAFDTELSAAFGPQGLRLLWSEEVLPAGPWIARYPSEPTATALARSVHPGHRVELGALTAEGPSASDTSDQPYLIIEEIEGVEPLDAQLGVWPRKTVPDALYEPLFGQPEPTDEEIAQYGSAEAVPPMKTYAILDAAKVPFLVIYLEDSGLHYRCLFKGAAEHDLKDSAPYIVELSDKSSFTRDLFTSAGMSSNMWDREPGIYIRSRASIDKLWKHYRKFTKIRDEEGRWYFYRFWDVPDKESINHSKERIAWFFLSPNDKVYNLRANSAHVLIIPNNKEKQSTTFILTNERKEKLAIEYQRKYVRDLLERDYKDVARTLTDDLKIEFSEHLARRFRHHGLTKSYSKETYLMAAVLLGTRFDEDILYPEVDATLSQDKPCYLRMTELKTQIFRKRDEIYGPRYENYARALKRIAEQDEEQVLSLAQDNKAVRQVLQLFPERAQSISEAQLHRLIDICNTLSKNHFVEDKRRFGAVVLLSHTFVLGAACADDPLHDYLRKMLHSDEQEKARKIFRYGQKRAKAQLKAIEGLTKEKEVQNVTG